MGEYLNLQILKFPLSLSLWVVKMAVRCTGWAVGPGWASAGVTGVVTLKTRDSLTHSPSAISLPSSPPAENGSLKIKIRSGSIGTHAQGPKLACWLG